MRRSLRILSVISLLALASCGGGPATGSKPLPADFQVTGARDGVTHTLGLGTTVRETVARPPSLLAIYAGIFLADGLDLPVQAARVGIDAQLSLAAPIGDEELDHSYELLEEFAAVLHIDVADMLNRSPERARTLDDYLTGLSNITERSRRKADDLESQEDLLQAEEKERRKEVTTIDREIRDATKAKDFATAGARQRALIDAQEKQTRVTFALREVSTLRETFEELIGVAEERIAAIESNREILIAGLRAVDVPGVEDLNVIEGAKRRRTRGGTFGTF